MEAVDDCGSGALARIRLLDPGRRPFPDDKRFGVFWMRRRDLAAAFDLDGAFNDVVFTLGRDVNVPGIIESVDQILARYGGLGAYARKDQTSAWYLENELAQLANMGTVTPFIFAAVARSSCTSSFRVWSAPSANRSAC